MKTRVVAAMSGGVDSSVCAYLLKREGYDVIGVTIKTWGRDDCRDERSKGCCSIRDIDDARSVAGKLGIPYYVLDLSSDFKEKVIDPFVAAYLNGRTPNPCIECNRHIKFGILLRKAEELGASFVATGHYARKGFDEAEKRFYVAEGADAAKDQSYVLFGLSQEQLARTLLPIGDLSKDAVRALARELGLRVSDKPDSQEICFVKTRYTDFLRETAGDRLPKRGALVNSKGNILGTHKGIHEFTIGQRKRIEIQSPEPCFVTAIRPETQEVVIGPESGLYQKEMRVGEVNWFLKPRRGKVAVKIRSRHPKTQARIVRLESGRVRVRFEEPQKAVTPGQAAVFYDGPKVLGGGWILAV